MPAKRRRTPVDRAESEREMALYFIAEYQRKAGVVEELAAKHWAELEANPPADEVALGRRRDAGKFLDRLAQFYRGESARLERLAPSGLNRKTGVLGDLKWLWDRASEEERAAFLLWAGAANAKAKPRPKAK
jgi:hypothetical protein